MKDDIDKINEQIDRIMSSSEKREDMIEAIDDSVGDTKKIDQIQDLEEEREEVSEPTKKMDVIEEKEEVVEEVSVPSSGEIDDTISREIKSEISHSNKRNMIILVVLALFAILIAILLYFYFQGRQKHEEEPVAVNYKSVLKRYGDALTGIVAVYYDKKEILLTYEEASELVMFDYDVDCMDHVINEDGSVYLNRCTIDGEIVSSSYGKLQEEKPVVIPEGNVKIYVSRSSGVASFEEPENVEKYDVYGIDIDESYQNLSFLDSKDSDYVYYAVTEGYNTFGRMMNYKTGKQALEDVSYQSIIPIQINEGFDTEYAAVRVDNRWGFYDIIHDKMIVKPQYDSVTPSLYYGISGPALTASTLEKHKMPVYLWDGTRALYGVVDYTSGKYSVPLDCNQMLKSGSYLWCTNADGDGKIYDYSGNTYLEGNYTRIFGVVDGKYVLVQDKQNVKMVSLKGNVLYDYGKYSFKRANYFLSYDKGALFQFVNTTLGEDYDYDMDESCIEFIYSSQTKKGEAKTTYCGGIAKPILYLYPEEKTNVMVSFAHPEFLETTYPKFVNHWQVTAYPNGDLYDQDGKYYYGLYWDEKKVHTVDFKEGFYVEKKDAISFLEEKLDEIGLSPKEKNEFIMYWLPILEKNGKNLVYFELTEERESVNPIYISPKPDSLLRVVIHVKKVSSKVNIQEEKLTHFERSGFTAVEWGGTTY